MPDKVQDTTEGVLNDASWLEKQTEVLRHTLHIYVALGAAAIGAAFGAAAMSGGNVRELKGIVNANATRGQQLTTDVAELARIARQNRAEVQAWTTELRTFTNKMNGYMATLNATTQTFVNTVQGMDKKIASLPTTVGPIVLTAANIDKEYIKLDRLRFKCPIKFSTESTVVWWMEPRLLNEPEGLTGRLQVTADPIQEGDGGCYIYLHTSKDNVRQRAEIETFLREADADNELRIVFFVYSKKR